MAAVLQVAGAAYDEVRLGMQGSTGPEVRIANGAAARPWRPER
jgi:hypothetical protein